MSQFCALAARVPVKQQSVIGGTKISESGVNNLVDSECSDSYFGCMDGFCMLDNVSGGRCLCSNKHAELSKKLNQLMERDERAENVAEYAGDYIRLGAATDGVLKTVNEATQKKSNAQQTSGFSRADWDNMFASIDDDKDEDFVDLDDISNKQGDALYNAAHEMCLEQTPSKCNTTKDMLQMMYAQKIKSDCVAFENSIKKQESEINVKLRDAEQSVRAVAFNEFQNANKYGLGQCQLEFKKCMQTTAGCGNDFVGCVSLSAFENVNQSGKKVAINNALTDIDVSASTMDTLIAKSVLCESVLNNCVNVKDKVWNAFLKDVAPLLKTAELNAEDNLRQSCISNISECYVKSCHEHFDVNQESGSYDMCLSRPENYKSFCRVELDPCLNATGGSYENPSASRLWNGVLSALAALRADACNKEFKSCITDDDRCGADYSKCIGLDGEDIALLCPDDKLTACYHEYEGNVETVRETLANIANGVMLGVQSELLNACQKAVDDAMTKVCGDVDSCDAFIVGEGVGGRSLELKFCEYDGNNEYKNCKQSVKEISDIELGKTVRNSDLSTTKNDRHGYVGVITGQIAWENIEILSDYSGIVSGDDYIATYGDIFYMDDKVKSKIKTEVGSLSNAIKNLIATIESEPRVQFCTTGRQVAGLTSDNGFKQFIGKENNPTFPRIMTNARIMIIERALALAQKNYAYKYSELMKENINETAQLNERYSNIAHENIQRGREDVARQKCLDLGEKSGISGVRSNSKSAKHKVVRDSGNDGNLVGYSSESTYNFKRSVTTTFNIDKMICTKCVRTQNCDKVKKDYCKKWGDEQETCEDIQY